MNRIASYYSLHGFSATLRRVVLEVRRALFSNRMVVFYCDLAEQAAHPPDLRESLTVDG